MIIPFLSQIIFVNFVKTDYLRSRFRKIGLTNSFFKKQFYLQYPIVWTIKHLLIS